MYYTTNPVQNASADFENRLVIPSMLTDFVNTGTSVEVTKGGKEAYCFHVDLDFDINNYRCPDCNCRTHIHNKSPVRLWHLCFGGRVSFVMLDKHRFICPECGKTVMQRIPFKANHHNITQELPTFFLSDAALS